MIFSRRKQDYSKKKDDRLIYLTADGFARLKAKLASTKKRLPALAEETRRTAAYGDRSENAEYKEAKGLLRRANAQIISLGGQINRVVVIKTGPARIAAALAAGGPNALDRVEIGSTVVLEAEGPESSRGIGGKDGSAHSTGSGLAGSPRAGARKTFEIVGSHETDPAHGRISYESPLGSALMGRSKGDKVTIDPPAGGVNGRKIYRIIKIQ